MSCSSKYCKEVKKKVCKICGNEFTPFKSTQAVCSNYCNNVLQYEKKQEKRKKNAIISKTKTELNNLIFEKHKRELKQKMFDDYGFYFCTHCNRTVSKYRMETHHLFWRSEYPNHKNLHDKKNLKLLCKKCHDDFHNVKSMRDNIVKERGLKKLFE